MREQWTLIRGGLRHGGFGLTVTAILSTAGYHEQGIEAEKGWGLQGF